MGAAAHFASGNLLPRRGIRHEPSTLAGIPLMERKRVPEGWQNVCVTIWTERSISVVPPGLVDLAVTANPALKCWAIFSPSLRDKMRENLVVGWPSIVGQNLSLDKYWSSVSWTRSPSSGLTIVICGTINRRSYSRRLNGYVSSILVGRPVFGKRLAEVARNRFWERNRSRIGVWLVFRPTDAPSRPNLESEQWT